MREGSRYVPKKKKIKKEIIQIILQKVNYFGGGEIFLNSWFNRNLKAQEKGKF